MPRKSAAISQKRRKVYIFLTLVLLLTTALVVKKFYKRENPYEKQLHLLSEEINRTCPLQVDQRMRLDNTQIVGKNEFRYNFTLTNLEKGSFDEPDLKRHLSDQILNSLKENDGMEVFRAQATKISYHYKDMHGQTVFELSFDKDDYN